MSRRLLLFLISQFFVVGTGMAQVANFTFSPTSGCSPMSVNFTDLSTGIITNYSWNLGNSNTSTLQNPSTTYSNPGTYYITLTVTGPGGSSSKTDTLIAYDKPAVSFSAATLSGCNPLTTQFNSSVTANSPGTVSYAWDFGDGNTGTGASPSHQYTTPGTYPVSLTVTNGAGCVRTVLNSGYITVYPVPVASFTAAPRATCGTPSTVSFTNTTTGGTTPYTVAWSFGDGGTGTGNTTTHVYNTGGAFNIGITVTDAHGCASSTNNAAYITVNTAPATFTGPTTLCFGDGALYYNTTPGADSTHWDFGDGYTTFGTSAFHPYANAGNYTVTMTTFVGPCTKTKQINLVINPRPNITLTQNPSIPCPAPPPSTVTYTASSAPGSSFVYKNGSGNVVNSSAVYTKTYNQNVMDTMTVVVTNSFGCKDSIYKDDIKIRQIIVNIVPGPGPHIPDKLDPYAGCIPLVVNFSVNLYSSLPPPPIPDAYDPYPASAVTYLWDFGDGSPTSTLATPVHTYSTVGTDTVTCTITTSNGCTAVGRRVIHADTKIHPSFYATPLVACPHDTVFFHNTTHTTATGVSYIWEVGEGNSIVRLDTNVIGYPYQWPGIYDVRLYTDHNGCFDDTLLSKYVEVHPPGSKFSYYVNCPPSLSVQFTDQSDSATDLVWIFGDGTTSTATNPLHAYTSTGTYIVKLAAYNSVYGCRDTSKATITIYTAPPAMSVTKNAICTGDYVEFSAQFVRSGTIEYSWIIDGVQTPFSEAPILDYQFNDSGFHNVWLVAKSGNGCFDTLKNNKYILVSRPLVGFKAVPPTGCKPLTVNFVDTSHNTSIVPTVTRFWQYNNLASANNTPASTYYTYYFTGNYSVKLIVTDSLGCTDSAEYINYVHVYKPIAAFTAAKDSVCSKAPLLFTNTSSGALPLSYLWDFGDGLTDTAANPIHRYLHASVGKYTVRLIVTDGVGCKDTLTMPNYIFVDAPTAGFKMSDSLAICPPLPIQFTDQSIGAVAWSWNFDNGSGPVTIQNPVSTFSSPKQYNVYQVAINVNGCTDTARATVRVLGYNGAFNYTPIEGCVPMTVTFSPPTSGIPKITWDFSDGITTITSGAGTTHTYLSPGSYIPKVIFSDGASCTSLSTGLDTIKVDQVKADFNWSVPCVGAAFTLTQSSTGIYKNPNSWFWSFGGGDTAVGASPLYTYSSSGSHAVTMIAKNATGCKDTITKQVYINPLPIVKAPKDKGLCPGDSVLLIATGAKTYVWGPANLVSCTACNGPIAHVLATPTYYFVTGTDSNGCVNKDSVKVYIQLKTTDTTGPGGEVCIGDTFRLFADGADHYTWSPAASLDSPNIASPLATPGKTTTYLLVAQEGTCKEDSVRITVVVHSLPIFSAGNDEITGRGIPVILHPTSIGITKIEWKPDTTLSCWDCFLPAANPRYTHTYYATGYNEFGCKVTDSVVVYVHCNGDLVFIPNTFSPNNDGSNDYFFPRGLGIDVMSSFRIFNRWGQMVFERNNLYVNDEKAGWDGTFKGQPLPPDVYVYTMLSTCEDGSILRWKGDITLLR